MISVNTNYQIVLKPFQQVILAVIMTKFAKYLWELGYVWLSCTNLPTFLAWQRLGKAHLARRGEPIWLSLKSKGIPTLPKFKPNKASCVFLLYFARQGYWVVAACTMTQGHGLYLSWQQPLLSMIYCINKQYSQLSVKVDYIATYDTWSARLPGMLCW